MTFFQKNMMLLPFLVFSIAVSASDSTTVQFQFSGSLNASKFNITVHNGIFQQKIKISPNSTWRGELFSPLGHILVGYPINDSTVIEKKFYFKKGDTRITLTKASSPVEVFSFDKRSSLNIIPYEDAGGTKLDAFMKDIVSAQIAFYHQNKSKFGANPSLLQQQLALADSVKARKLNFIIQYPDLYVSFWTFLIESGKWNILPANKTLETFSRIFPEKYIKTKAGIHLTNILKNKIAVTTHQNFPEFSTIDLNGLPISSSQLRENYVLIQFWASWCIPCIEEIPALKEIYEKYGQSAFKLISFSIDKDSLACRKAIKKNAMNWPQVFGDNRLYTSLGYTPIPQLYFIDKAGRTLYNSNAVDDADLILLKKILSEQLDR